MDMVCFMCGQRNVFRKICGIRYVAIQLLIYPVIKFHETRQRYPRVRSVFRPNA